MPPIKPSWASVVTLENEQKEKQIGYFQFADICVYIYISLENTLRADPTLFHLDVLLNLIIGRRIIEDVDLLKGGVL